jgi:hypothetical protein
MSLLYFFVLKGADGLPLFKRLVRPNQLLDLLLAKALSVTIVLQALILIADLLGALMNGFPLLSPERRGQKVDHSSLIRNFDFV